MKKMQCSVHLPENMVQIIRQRAATTKRSFSGEIEYILEKYFTRRNKENEEAIMLAERGNLNPSKPQAVAKDEHQHDR